MLPIAGQAHYELLEHSEMLVKNVLRSYCSIGLIVLTIHTSCCFFAVLYVLLARYMLFNCIYKLYCVRHIKDLRNTCICLNGWHKL
jgi:hypothetical protein